MSRNTRRASAGVYIYSEKGYGSTYNLKSVALYIRGFTYMPSVFIFLILLFFLERDLKLFDKEKVDYEISSHGWRGTKCPRKI